MLASQVPYFAIAVGIFGIVYGLIQHSRTCAEHRRDWEQTRDKWNLPRRD